MVHNRVTVVFQPSSATQADAVTAANRHVFLTVTAGTMTVAKTSAAGLLTTAAGAAIPLDDARTYQVVISSSPIGSAPSATAGVVARVSAGRLILQPQIAIHVVQSTGGAAARLACKLTVGATTTAVTTSANGWIVSTDEGTGAVTLACDTRLLSTAGATAPTITLTQPASIERGSTARFPVTAPAAAIAFKVTEWSYVASHTNPASTTAQTATIVRPAAEAAATFNQAWEGVMCASGALTVRFVTGASLRTAGSGAVDIEATSAPPVVHAADVTVANRAWTTTLVENAEAALTVAITTFHNTGRHDWAPRNASVTPLLIAAGPNRGATFASASGLEFVSSPFVNAAVTDAASAFSLAQDSARMVAPAGVRNQVIPRRFYSVGAGGTITITDEPGMRTHFSLPTQAFSFTAHNISQPALLAGVQRHEHNHPTEKSHKGNCKKALRALEPRVFVERLVDLPGGATVNITTLFNQRVAAVSGVGATHNIVDETQTAADNVVRFTAGQSIPGVNSDAAGALIGPVWNPTTNTQLGN